VWIIKLKRKILHILAAMVETLSHFYSFSNFNGNKADGTVKLFIVGDKILVGSSNQLLIVLLSLFLL